MKLMALNVEKMIKTLSIQERGTKVENGSKRKCQYHGVGSFLKRCSGFLDKKTKK